MIKTMVDDGTIVRHTIIIDWSGHEHLNCVE